MIPNLIKIFLKRDNGSYPVGRLSQKIQIEAIFSRIIFQKKMALFN